ncbi:probable disease resistance protein At1g61300 [Typha angustifolia]|uniref:probable disease resistance protein At1g61300 n=1 Tax=Typha angustifolia TaxID=59011 RepID=UPI003C2D93DA
MKFIDIVSKMITPLLYPFNPLINLMTMHVIYPFNTGDNVKGLVDATKDLVVRKDDVERRIRIAKRDGLVPTHQVGWWLEKVKNIVIEAEAIERKYANRRFKCLGGCSINCCSNYSLSRIAAEKLLDVEKFYAEGDFAVVGLTPAPPPSPPPVQEVSARPTSSSPAVESKRHRFKFSFLSKKRTPSPAGQEVPAGSTPLPVEQEVPATSTLPLVVDLNLQVALEYINEDGKLGMIGIWGMGGVGKTHLLNKIHKSLDEACSFGHVILVTASKECSVEKVQEALVKKLLLPEKKNDIDSQADVIRNYLKAKSFVLLLDDLWGRLDLEAVGIPFPVGVDSKYKQKVVLTTRSENVCGLMKVQKKIKVKCLNEEDARRLFLEHVGEEALNSDPQIPDYAEQILKELDGLPLALITTGSSMYSKKDPREWKHAIDLLRKSRLDDVELADMSNMGEAYNAGHGLIGDLKAACLLEAAGEDHVKMHDVIRDMALWIMCNDGKNKNQCVVRGGVGLEEAPREINIWFEAEQISLMRNRMHAFHFPIIPCPTKLKTLMLQWNELSTVIGTIKNFDALTNLDLSHNSFDVFPIVICSLPNLQYLNLSQNRIESLPDSLRSLTNLKHLLLRDNKIHKIPDHVIGELKALEVLDIVNCYSNKDLSYLPSLFEDLESLANLKAVGMDLQELSQLKRLAKLSFVPVISLNLYYFDESSSLYLPISSFTNTGIHMNLSELRIFRAKFEQIKFKSNDRRFNLRNLEKLSFVDLASLKEIVCEGLAPKDLFPNLTRLEFSYCEALENISWIVYLPCLRILEMSECTTMKQIVCNDQNNHGDQNVAEIEEERARTPPPTFPCLRRIILSFFKELTDICDPAVSFPSLESLEVFKCPNLKKLPFGTHSNSSKLKSIKGERAWWDGLVWADENLKSSLQSFYQEQYSIDSTVSYM